MTAIRTAEALGGNRSAVFLDQLIFFAHQGKSIEVIKVGTEKKKRRLWYRR
jgi:hypothetical protein